MKKISNEKGSISELEYRTLFTNVRGGWTKEKIKKELKTKRSDSSLSAFYRETAKYDTPEEFEKNLFYHGSGGSIGALKPSISLKNAVLGGGYDQRYFGISLSSDRDMASNFTGVSSYGCVAPVLLKRDAVVKVMPEIQDSVQLNDIIEELWDDGIDAVMIGNHEMEMSEKEIVILNPRCISVGKSYTFAVFEKPTIPSFEKDVITQMWIDSSEQYKECLMDDMHHANNRLKDRTGEEREVKWVADTKQDKLCKYHQHNVEIYKNKLNNKKSNKIKKSNKNKI